MKDRGSTLSAVFFISGTAIGAGMLALPFATAKAGLLPSVAISLLCWLFMMATGLLYLEAALWMPDGSNMLSITHRFLGRWGRLVCALLFLFLYNSLMIAYFSGTVPLLAEMSGMNQSALFVVVALLFGVVLFAGTRIADRLNFLLIAGLALSYLILLAASASDLDLSLLLYRRWPYAFFGLPFLLGAYGYHNIVPTLATYLRRDSRRLRWAIIIGSSIPFVVYTLWQVVVMGTASPESLAQSFESGAPINDQLPKAAQFFALFALVTSILGVGLSMIDFLGDGLKIPRKGVGRILLCLIALLPALLLAWSLPGLFFVALSYAGGLGEAVLNGLLPVLMVWVGRYRMKLHSDWRLPGGRPMLTLLLGGVAVIIGVWLWELAS